MREDHSSLKLTYKNIDTYFPLSKKVDVINRLAPTYFNGELIDIGCGRMPYKKLILDNSNVSSYTGVDIENPRYQDKIKPDLYWDGVKIPLENGTKDTAILIEVLEHVPDPNIVLQEINNKLKSGGYLFITVPFLWTLHDIPNDEYRYTPFALRRLLENSNFEIIELESFGSWHSSMASMLALYARRANFGRRRKVLSILLMPIIKYLDKKDKQLNHKTFDSGEMITGLWCIAKKK